jgi:hypothetical protein
MFSPHQEKNFPKSQNTRTWEYPKMIATITTDNGKRKNRWRNFQDLGKERMSKIWVNLTFVLSPVGKRHFLAKSTMFLTKLGSYYTKEFNSIFYKFGNWAPDMWRNFFKAKEIDKEQRQNWLQVCLKCKAFSHLLDLASSGTFFALANLSKCWLCYE